MSLTYRSILILYCIQKLNGERTAYGIFHLLNGKKSSQTIGDANLFDLTFMFGILKPLDRVLFDKEIKILFDNALIKEVDPSSKKITLTPNGNLILKRELNKKPIPKKLDGWKYNERSKLLWRRLSLLTQVLSNLIDGNKRYTPIQPDESISDWVKAYVMSYSHNRFTLAESLYKEVIQCLERVSELEASIFVMRLTSSTRIGYTIDQISSFLGEDEVWCQVLFIHTLHTIVQHVENNKLHFPILTSMIGTHTDAVLLTASTQKTYQLLIQGNTIEEIAIIRNLKRNTIEDHIVEVTHQQSSFTIDPFVPLKHQQLIVAAYKDLQTKQLRTLREKLPEGISYFEIRLVLAKFGGKHESY